MTPGLRTPYSKMRVIQSPVTEPEEDSLLSIIKSLRSKIGISKWKFQKNIDQFIKRINLAGKWALDSNPSTLKSPGRVD